MSKAYKIDIYVIFEIYRIKKYIEFVLFLDENFFIIISISEYFSRIYLSKYDIY